MIARNSCRQCISYREERRAREVTDSGAGGRQDLADACLAVPVWRGLGLGSSAASIGIPSADPPKTPHTPAVDDPREPRCVPPRRAKRYVLALLSTVGCQIYKLAS